MPPVFFFALEDQFNNNGAIQVCMSNQREQSEPGKGVGYRVWDSHVHCYPDSVIADPVGFSRRQGEAHWLDLVTNGPQGWSGPDDLIRAMDRDGIEKALLLGWYWENPATCRLQNEWHADWIQRFPDRLLAAASIHPDDPDPLVQLEQAESWGAVGVGECLPCKQCPAGWSHPAWEAIIDWTTARGWPINLHVTEPAGHDYPGRVETPLMELLQLFGNHPRQKWICAHWGGGLPFYHLNHRVRKVLANVWFDTAAGPLLYAPEVWKSVVNLVGSGRVLFGSDFPLMVYPRKEREPGWAGLLREAAGSGLEPAELERIFRTNLLELLPGRA